MKRSTYYGTDSDFEHDTVNTLTARFEHDFNDNTTLRNTTRWSEIRQKYLLSAAYGKTISVVDGNVMGSRLMNSSDTLDKILTNQTNLTTKFDTWGVKHNVSTGVELTQEDYDSYPYAFSSNSVNLLNPDSDTAVSRATGYSARGRTKTFGIYAFDTLKLTSRLEVNGGARLDSYNTHYVANSLNSTTNKVSHSNLTHSGIWLTGKRECFII